MTTAEYRTRMASGEKIAAGSSLHEVFHRHSREAQQHLATINTFLEAHDLAGKRIVSFFTSGGSGAGKTLDYLKPSAPKATFETPKNLTHADESAIRTWVQMRLKPSTSASNSFPTFAVDIATNLLLYSAPSLPRR